MNVIPVLNYISLHDCLCCFRLEHYDRNRNFGKQIEPEPEFHMQLPGLESFKDVNSNSELPFLTYEAIREYVRPYRSDISDDAKNLYTNRFLKYVRSSEVDNVYFVTCECRSHFRKRMTYHVHVSLDEDGSVLEGQCECTAGQGPTCHCKHLCALLFAVHQLSVTGELLTEKTCTQQLQGFHKARPFKGSPIKASTLPSSIQEVNFDPRPRKFRKQEGYEEQFRSIWLNHPRINAFPVSHLFQPANTYAVSHDHTYTGNSLDEEWLKVMTISEVSEEEICKVEERTRDQANCDFWKEQHQIRITSSNFGRICVATQRTDLKNLALSLMKPVEHISAPALKHGRKYEKVALKKFEMQEGVKTLKCGMFVSKELPFLAASPDALLGQNAVVEIKCPFSARHRIISELSVPFLKYINDQLTLDPSHKYFYQVQGQLYCSRRDMCIFIVFTLKDMIMIRIPRNDDFIQEMLKKLKDFYDDFYKPCILNEHYFHNYYNYSW